MAWAGKGLSLAMARRGRPLVNVCVGVDAERLLALELSRLT
jgi:hypothetical protein